MYLENIFVGSEDIRKQLPQESLLFERVHHAFSAAMRQLQAAGNVVAATTPPEVLKSFEVGAQHSHAQMRGAVVSATACLPARKAGAGRLFGPCPCLGITGTRIPVFKCDGLKIVLIEC
jgi:hypothetical protein